MNKIITSRDYGCEMAAALLGISMVEMRKLALRHGIERDAVRRGPAYAPQYLPRQIVDLRNCAALAGKSRRGRLSLSASMLMSPLATLEAVTRRKASLAVGWKEGGRSGIPCDACAVRACVSSMRCGMVRAAGAVYQPSAFEPRLNLCGLCQLDYLAYKAAITDKRKRKKDFTYGLPENGAASGLGIRGTGNLF